MGVEALLLPSETEHRYSVPRPREALKIDTTQTPSTSRRDPTIDGLKLAAAACIVMVHTAMQVKATALPSFVEQISYSALYFFFLVAGYFHGPLGGHRGFKWLRTRFVRLAVPYYVWSGLYILWWNVYHLIRHWPPYFPDPVRVLFFAGATEVLWSLPWLFACALLAELLARTPLTRRLLIGIAAVATLAIWVFVPMSALPKYGIRQFIEGGRWVVVYVTGMEVRAMKSVGGHGHLWMSLAVVCSIAAGTFAIFVGPQPTTLGPAIVMFFLNCTVAASLLAGARVGAKWFGVGRLGWGGDYLLGVYVAHSMCLSILLRIIPASSMPVYVWLPFGWAVGFGAALGITHLLLSSRWTRLAVT